MQINRIRAHTALSGFALRYMALLFSLRMTDIDYSTERAVYTLHIMAETLQLIVPAYNERAALCE